MRLILLFIFIPLITAYSQSKLPVNDSVQNFLFGKSSLDKPILITENGMYEYNFDWKYYPFSDGSFKREISKLDELNHANFFTKLVGNDLYIISNGAGPVFKKSANNFIRIDNSTLHRNQFGGAHFVYNNKIHIYGGYGFWSFKNFITFFDENIKQWDILYNNSLYVPPGRWKPIYAVVGDKFYTFGGRAGSPGTIKEDEVYSDVFYFDLINNEYINLGKLNPKLKTNYSLFTQPMIGSNIFMIENDVLTKIDFNLLAVTSYFKKNLFDGVDNKFPTFISNQNLIFISNKNNDKYLNFFDLGSVDGSFVSDSFQLIDDRNKISIYQYIYFIIFISLVFWIILKIFSFKDFIKGLVLYDENNIYYNNKSAVLTPNEKELISYLSENIFITAPNVNKIISDQKFAKSHFTSLRTKLVTSLNQKLYMLTNNKNCIIETKHPKDNRIKVYKVDSSIIKRKIGFIRFLFKS